MSTLIYVSPELLGVASRVQATISAAQGQNTRMDSSEIGEPVFSRAFSSLR